jgi:hypothetical protein
LELLLPRNYYAARVIKIASLRKEDGRDGNEYLKNIK